MYKKYLIKVLQDETIKNISLHEYIDKVKGNGNEEWKRNGFLEKLGPLDETPKDQKHGSEELAWSVDRGNNSPANEGQIVALYIDIKSDTDVEAILYQLSYDPCVLMAHLNSTKDGMIIIFLLPDGRQSGPFEMETICQYTEDRLELEVNRVETVKLSIALPIAYDPDAYVNLGAWGFGFNAANGVNPQVGNPEFVNPAKSPILDDFSYLDEEVNDLEMASGNNGNNGNNGSNGNGGNEDIINDQSFQSINLVTVGPHDPFIFPKELIPLLPKMLQRLAKTGETEIQRDLAIIAAFTVLSSIMPNVSFFYSKRLFLNLYMFVIASAGEGKSKVDQVSEILRPLHKRLVKECTESKAKYNQDKKAFEESGIGPRPLYPDCKGIYIAEDITHPALVEKLASKSELNLLVSTEADSLNRTMHNEAFNKSDLFRKAFQHESISYSRMKDLKDIIAENPKLSSLITGTPGTIEGMIKGAEDGTSSRYAYYWFTTGKFEWEDQQSESKKFAHNEILSVADTVTELFDFIQGRNIDFDFTKGQRVAFNNFFRDYVAQLDHENDGNFFASVKRHGIIFVRIAAVLTVVEYYEKADRSQSMICSDNTFNACLMIIRVLLEHSRKVYAHIQKKKVCSFNQYL
ncbi:MAG: DUF3987 domain-containing protein [Saprospiraceae bacterium]|nr:DUF3987 domain-containing protein [Saprospiraceae bacterium]